MPPLLEITSVFQYSVANRNAIIIWYSQLSIRIISNQPADGQLPPVPPHRFWGFRAGRAGCI